MKKRTFFLLFLLGCIIAAGALEVRERNRSRMFAATFHKKMWYYSFDGIHWVDRAEGGFSRFDRFGNPIHTSSVLGYGMWEDENTIYWKGQNESESVWKAFESPPF